MQKREKLKILLLNPSKEKEVSFAMLDDYNKKARNNNHPLGLLYLYSYLIQVHDVYIVDMDAEELNIIDIIPILDKYKPDLVGITCVISKWITVKELSKVIKEYNKNIKIVVGGVNPSLYTYETLQCVDIDFIIRGFGQKPLMILCNQLENNSYKDGIQNCFSRNIYKENTKGIFNFEDVDEYPFPNRTVLPMNYYYMPYSPENPTTSMITSLGCPYVCKYCQCRTFKPVIIRKPEKVADELEEIFRLGFKTVIFQDELFTMSDKRIKDICSLIKERDIKLNWAVRARANPLKMESLELMKESGCFNIHLGIESGNPRILEKMNKRTTVEQIKESVKRIKESGISCSASFMLGYPSETKEEIMDTINFASDLDLNLCQFYITIPSPGTEIYEEWKTRTGYEGDIFSKFTLNPEEVDLSNNIASDIFTKQELIDFVKLGFSKTKNLYKIKEGSVGKY